MRKIRIVICDDEQLELDFYTAFCQKLAYSHNIPVELKTYNSGNKLLFDFENPRLRGMVDILFLDINMPGTDGITVAKNLRSLGYLGVLVFITVSKEHYEQAFDVGAFNYVTKGENAPKRFTDIFFRALEQAESLREEIMLLSSGGEYRQIKIKDIRYFRISKKIITVHYGENTFEFISTLEKIENQLFSRGFQRIHRSILVALSSIKSISYQEIVLHEGERLPVGRKYYPALKKSMAELHL